jgi:hypothetical protein
LLGSAGDSLLFVLQPSPHPPLLDRDNLPAKRAYIESLKAALRVPICIGSIDRRKNPGQLLPHGSAEESLFIDVLRTAAKPSDPSFTGHIGSAELADFLVRYLEHYRREPK